MKYTKAVLLAVLVTGLFACVGFADVIYYTTPYTPNFTIGFGYTITENHAPSFTGAVISGGSTPLSDPLAHGTAYLSQNGDWTIRANTDFQVTLEVTAPTGDTTGVALTGTWNPGFDPDNAISPPNMDHPYSGDQQLTGGATVDCTWRATTADGGSASAYNTFISTLVLNYGVHRNALDDPADTYTSTVTVTVSQP